MEIFQNFNLVNLNTFGIEVKAKYFVSLEKKEDIFELFSSEQFKKNEKLFLGGGSNILFTKDFDGMIILNKLKGIEIIKENPENVWIRAEGGEDWNDLVSFAVDRDLWGLENLALIPGTVGASPVQNIGAYGVEIKDVLEEVEAYEIKTGQKRIFSKEDCAFGYRNSIFKNELKGKYFISAIVLKLRRFCWNPDFTSGLNKKTYPALEKYLEENNLEIKNSKDVSKAISEIRRSKLPDPKIIGNAGSFFKNVYIDQEKFNQLQKEFPEMPFFTEEDGVKIPAGWLIEQCGWKGYRQGNVGVHDKQALVLVNFGGAKGDELLDLAQKIIDSVYQKFGLKLNPEVNLI
jgi:UDP-N-acetylmuramate dehydrogenase